MAALTVAQAPSALVTAIPGRFAPTRIVDRRNMAAVVADVAGTSRNVFLPRAESLSVDFQTPTQVVEELGTSYNVGEYDQLAEVKVAINNYDVGTTALSLITGKATPAGTTTFAPTDLAVASVDLITQYADPNGKVFYSEYCGDLVIDGYGSSLKKGSAAMENFSLVGFNQLGFRGQFVTKAYIVQSADVTAKTIQLAAAANPVIGANEAPVGLPVPSGSQPPSYWIQRGALKFVKIERYRAATGWFRFKEASSAGGVVAGVCYYQSDANMTLSFNTGDLVAGDVFYVTYATYQSQVANYGTIPTTSLDTSDAIAVDTRLCNINVTAATHTGAVSRGQQFDLKVEMKRERADGIGDTDGLWAPPSQPTASLSMDVDLTGASVDSLLTTGLTTGTDGAGTITGDWVDPNYTTRVMLNTPTTVGVTVNDPRNSGAILKTITSSNAVFKQRTISAQAKSNVTVKYSGSDTVGNVQVSVTK